uniref:CRISPR associated sequence n=1 Tax=uncultured soil bacterium TaxID=164851 RepID=E2D2M4_9BACT|nr:CRISPR associated sequence [uncultured soil bacterium]
MLNTSDHGPVVDFGACVDRYHDIHQGRQGYGDGTRAEQATRFYLDHLLGETATRARAESRLPARPVDLLISLCGFTPVPTVLTHELLRPKRMVVVVSRDAEDSIDVIHDRVTRPSGPLRPRDFRHASCDPTDPLSIYRIVKEELDRTPAGDGRPYAIIDITGGRKVMSAAAAMAAWQLKLELSYVEGRFDPHTRHPIPGTDRLLILDDPTTLFGEQEMGRALEIFRAGAFEAARRRYDELCETLAVPVRARYMRALSEMYRAWCDLDLAALPAAVDALRQALTQVRRDLGVEHVDLLEEQVAFLSRLTTGDRNATLLCFYVLGVHYQQLARHDFAALLFYRTIEGCLTRRLQQRFPGLGDDRIDWALFGDPAAARQRYSRVAGELGAGSTTPPSRLMLMSSVKLLCAYDDELTRRCGLDDADGIRGLEDQTKKRNKSVLAHGFGTVTVGETEELRRRADSLLQVYWELHGDTGSLDEMCDRLQFVRTDR